MRIILLGPTASGKTELSLQFAEELDLPIISADSRQSYKRLDIGTAKPTVQELKRVKHYNISLFELGEIDTAQAFAERCEKWEKEILNTYEHTFFAGGSTLYLQSLIRPIDEMPPADAENIRLLEAEITDYGIESLYKKLIETDPAYVETMDGMNRQRVIRALDVWMQTGKPFSSFHENRSFVLPENTLVFGIRRNRDKLYNRINKRVDKMVEQGLFEEVEEIMKGPYADKLRELNTVGYREIIEYLDGNCTHAEAIEKIKTNSRRYAKRQITWFRRWDFIDWLDAEELSLTEMKERMKAGLF